jgi:hypothetical protein
MDEHTWRAMPASDEEAALQACLAHDADLKKNRHSHGLSRNA